MISKLMPKTIFVVAGHPKSLINFRLPLLLRFKSLGYNVHVSAPGLSEDREVYQILMENEIHPHDVPFQRVGMNPLSDLRAAWVLFRAMRAVRADIVLSYTVKPVIWGTLAAAAGRVPQRIVLITGLGYVFTADASGKRRIVRSILSKLYGIALRHADNIFFQNPDDASEFHTLGLLPQSASVSVVNGSGVDLTRFTPSPLPPTSQPLRFLLIARMLEDKGVQEFAVAAGRIKDTHPNVHFDLVGGTDKNPNSIPRETLERWKTEKGVTWHGSQADVRPYLANCHVFVLPSRYREGTPRSILEAMATGRPIITTDSPGCRETVVRGVNGFLIPPGDADALECAMRRLIDTPEIVSAMANESLRIAREKYDVRLVNNQMLQDAGFIR